MILRILNFTYFNNCTAPFAQVMIFELRYDPLILFSRDFFEHLPASYSLIDMPLIFQVHILSVL